MAVKIIHGHTCDDCEEQDLSEVPAPHSHVMSIDGRPFKQLDFCSPSERAVMGRLLQLYEERGRELEPEPKEEPAKETVTTRRAEPKELEQKKPKEMEQAPSKKASASKSERLQIWCPLEHDAEGQGKFVSYKTRVPHARRHGLEIWQIEWKDVHEILKASCQAHAECVKTNLAFLNQAGVHTHINKVALQRIDTTPEQDTDAPHH